MLPSKNIFFSPKKKYPYRQLNPHSPQNIVQNLINHLEFSLSHPGQNQAFHDIQKFLVLSNPHAPLAPRRCRIRQNLGRSPIHFDRLSKSLSVCFDGSPTEVLAKQHFKTFSLLLKPLSIFPDLLVSSLNSASKKEVIHRIQNGLTQIVIGTHALFSDQVSYHKLALVVIDEHHKFGVQQRIQIMEKGYNVDLLVMTATPIPRNPRLDRLWRFRCLCDPR